MSAIVFKSDLPVFVRYRQLAKEPCREGKAVSVFMQTLIATAVFKADENQRSVLMLSTKGQLQSLDAQTCLREKQQIYENRIKKAFKHEWHQNLSVFQLFSLWVEDLINLHRIHDPEDVNIEEYEYELFLSFAVWRDDPRIRESKVKFDRALEKMLDKVQQAAPDETEFMKMRASFEALIDDKCGKNHPWDPDLLACEIEQYLQPKFVREKKIKNLFFEKEMDESEMVQLFKGLAALALSNWIKIFPRIESIYGKYYKTQSSFIKFLIKNENDLQMMQGDLEGSYERIQKYFEHAKKYAPFGLFSLCNLPITDVAVLDRISDTLFEIENTFSHKYVIPKTDFESKEAVVKRLRVLGFEEPEIVYKVYLRTNECYQTINQLFDAYMVTVFHQMQVCYVAMRPMVERLLKEIRIKEAQEKKTAKLLEAKATEKLAQEKLLEKLKAVAALKAKRDEARAIERVKRAAVRALEKANEAPAQVVPVEEKIPELVETEVVVEPKRVKVRAEVKETVYYKGLTALPNASSDRRGICFAAHAELYRRHVVAARGLLNRHGADPEHRLNLRRLSYIAAGTFLETTLNFTNWKSVQTDLETHNLMQLWRVQKNPLLHKPAMLFDGACYLARFTHVQAKRINGFNVAHINSHIKLLNEWETGGAESLIERLNHCIQAFDTFTAGLNSKSDKPSSQMIPVTGLFPSENLDALIVGVDELIALNRANVLLKQWKDDLECLSSSLALLETDLAVEEYTALMAHLHLLIHSAVQSALYAHREQNSMGFTNNHNLVELWVESKLEFPDAVKTFLERELNDSSNVCRYPFRHPEPISHLHRIQLETIAMTKRPEILEGFQLAVDSKESSLSETLGWSPLLQNIRMPGEQKTLIHHLVDQTVILLRDHLLTQFQSSVQA